jgi:molybdopterin/thiamine biosynthesis adenylyltransferase
VAVAGASVGSGIAHAVMLDIRPAAIKIADKSVYKLENINRVRLSYADMVLSEEQRASVYDVGLKNKAETFADQVYSIDPFTNVFTYPEGITTASINEFFDGGDGEPPASIIIEEIDDPRTKILLREEARRRKIPLLMMTDIGSSVQLDLMRYDQDQSLPLAWGVSDSDLYVAMQRVYDQPGDRNVFFSFVDSIIGSAYRRDELGEIIAGTCEIPTSTIIPQLGSTALVAAGLAAEAIARLRLGHEYPRRCLINKRTLEIVRCDDISYIHRQNEGVRVVTAVSPRCTAASAAA